MSMKWKVIGGVIAVITIVAGIAWFAIGSNQLATVYAQSPPQIEVRLIDDDEDGIPDRGVVEVPESFGQRGRFGRQSSGDRPQIEVRLIDEDGDGIPDRGVVDLPGRAGFGRGDSPDRGGPGFGPDRDRSFGPQFGPGSRSFGPRRGPFFLLALCACLIGLAGLVGAGIYFYRRRSQKPAPASFSPPPPAATPAPISDEPPPEPPIEPEADPPPAEDAEPKE